MKGQIEEEAGKKDAAREAYSQGVITFVYNFRLERQMMFLFLLSFMTIMQWSI